MIKKNIKINTGTIQVSKEEADYYVEIIFSKDDRDRLHLTPSEFEALRKLLAEWPEEKK